MNLKKIDLYLRFSLSNHSSIGILMKKGRYFLLFEDITNKITIKSKEYAEKIIKECLKVYLNHISSKLENTKIIIEGKNLIITAGYKSIILKDENSDLYEILNYLNHLIVMEKVC